MPSEVTICSAFILAIEIASTRAMVALSTTAVSSSYPNLAFRIPPIRRYFADKMKNMSRPEPLTLNIDVAEKIAEVTPTAKTER